MAWEVLGFEAPQLIVIPTPSIAEAGGICFFSAREPGIGHQPFVIRTPSKVEKADFEGDTPPPPGPLESSAYAAYTAKIFGFKELTGKIFRTKDLSPEVSPEGHSSPIGF